MRLRSVAEQSCVTFLKFELRLDAEFFAELFGDLANRKDLRPGYVHHEGRGRTMIETSQANRVRIALPDDICESHTQIDRPPFEYRLRNVNQHSVSQLDSIV